MPQQLLSTLPLRLTSLFVFYCIYPSISILLRKIFKEQSKENAFPVIDKKIKNIINHSKTIHSFSKNNHFILAKGYPHKLSENLVYK